MGTQKSYEAPKTAAWRRAKTKFRRFATQGGVAAGGVAGVMDAYVRANGGPAAAASSAVAGKATLLRLGSFVGDVARLGFEDALRENGLGDLVGMGVEAVLRGIVDLLAPDGATHDDSDARGAAVAVLSKLLDEAATEDDLAMLFEDKANSVGVRDLFEQYLVQFVYLKMLRMLAGSLENSPVDAATKQLRSDEILDYVASRVKLALALFADFASLDFGRDSGRRLVDTVVQSAYEVFIV
jgi:hypothetical protein